MKPDELKECPFCGGEKTHISATSKICGYNGLDIPVYRYRASVRCEKCKARGTLASGRILELPDWGTLPSWATTKESIQAEAIAAWNRRAYEAEIERLRAAQPVKCGECKHLEVVNKEPIYAICGKTGTVIRLWEEDTRRHYCSYGRRKGE